MKKKEENLKKLQELAKTLDLTTTFEASKDGVSISLYEEGGDQSVGAIGFGLEDLDDTGFVAWNFALSVDNEYQGEGLGRLLLRAGIEALAAQEDLESRTIYAASVPLEAAKGGLGYSDLLAFYESEGFDVDEPDFDGPPATITMHI